MINHYDIIDTHSCRKLTHPEFHSALLGFAEMLEGHHFWKNNWVDWVAGAPQFRDTWLY